jgi:hypothetical protein
LLSAIAPADEELLSKFPDLPAEQLLQLVLPLFA